jgi:iron(III) transport system substrate-binding protein
MRRVVRPLLLAALLAVSSAAAHAQGQVVVYCSVIQEWCNLMTQEFTRSTGIRVVLTQRGSGETITQLRAESSNPRADVWWGGTGDPHLAAAEANITEVYRSPTLPQLHDWAVRQAELSGHRSVGIYAGALGFMINTQALARQRLPDPRCWSDLIRPEFRGEIQISNPASSGTAYTALATLIQVMGEDPAFEYLKRLHVNVNQYTRAGPAPARNTARGETVIGIGFLHDGVAEAIDGAPVRIVAPCEGTGYEVGSMSIVRGAPNMENARRFYEFALTPAAQALGARAKSYQHPSNRAAPSPPNAPDFAQMRLINYDFARFGTSAERARVIQRWEREVNSLPR